MSRVSSKRLSEIRGDFERGVFLALYDSPRQRWYRFWAATTLVFKHALRGVLFSWPLYLLAYASYVLPALPVLFTVLFVIPALYISWVILSRGVREDYSNLVDGYLLRSGYIGRMLFHGKT